MSLSDAGAIGWSPSAKQGMQPSDIQGGSVLDVIILMEALLCWRENVPGMVNIKIVFCRVFL